MNAKLPALLDLLAAPAAACATCFGQNDGSGLYDADRFTPHQIVELLRHAYRDFRFAADFVGSFAVAGISMHRPSA